MRKRGANFKGKRDSGAWARAIGMAQPLTGDQRVDLGLAVHGAIERLRTGHAVENDWHTLAAAVNVSLILAEKGAGREYLPEVNAAQEALVEMLERHKRTGKWAFSGTGYQAVTRVIELHEAQLGAVTRDSARAALMEVYARVERGEVLNREEECL